MEITYECRKIGMAEIEAIKKAFADVFTKEPWNDDWSDNEQLQLYLTDLIGQGNSLAYGLFEAGNLIAVAMGRIRHWYSGTEYAIDEFFVQTEKQKSGIGTYFLKEIEKELKGIGIAQIFLQTEKNVPAYDFYRKNGYHEIRNHVSFVKKLGSRAAERNGDLRGPEKELIGELNSLGIKGLAVDKLNCLNGAYVNLAYPLPNGTAAKFLNDDEVYLGCQIERAGSDRCLGVVANEKFLLVCEYGCNGTEPELLLYRKR